eukprot:scaffold89610_cov66-Phaeocystis_antarctica.AAC.1
MLKTGRYLVRLGQIRFSHSGQTESSKWSLDSLSFHPRPPFTQLSEEISSESSRPRIQPQPRKL